MVGGANRGEDDGEEVGGEEDGVEDVEEVEEEVEGSAKGDGVWRDRVEVESRSEEWVDGEERWDVTSRRQSGGLHMDAIAEVMGSLLSLDGDCCRSCFRCCCWLWCSYFLADGDVLL